MCVLSSIKINTDNFTQCEYIKFKYKLRSINKRRKHLLVSYPFIKASYEP